MTSGKAEPSMRDKNEGTYQEVGEGTTLVTTACPEDRCEGKTSCELSWKVKVRMKKKKKTYRGSWRMYVMSVIVRHNDMALHYHRCPPGTA